jgi:hypothetical protein
MTGYKLTNEERRAGIRAVQERADARAAELAPVIRDLRAAGATSLRAIADALNQRRIPTPRGGRWQAGNVSRLLCPDRRLERPPAARAGQPAGVRLG